MKQICYPYTEWEDYAAGMYNIPTKPYREGLVEACVQLLSDEKEFYKILLQVLDEWTLSGHTHLSNPAINRQAWLGQAACCYKYKAEELVTREAWSRMKPIDRLVANSIADKITGIYEEKNRALYPNVGSERLC